ncbi:hypothetical protein K501DRAFT_273134 [Backusella circina FSU 941]|nr:hypothetical protein K501DRAFT_273134 [Backusella circina FSU 941]
MSLAVINATEATTIVDDSSLGARKQILKRKVVAIGKLANCQRILRDNSDLVKQLKSLSNGKMPVGVLSKGEEGIKEAIVAFSSDDFTKLKEQKDQIAYQQSATPNYKVAREGHV